MYVSRFLADDTGKQEDRVVTVPDLNVHIPETTQLDRGVARSYFAVFDGREYMFCLLCRLGVSPKLFRFSLLILGLLFFFFSFSPIDWTNALQSTAVYDVVVL